MKVITFVYIVVSDSLWILMGFSGKLYWKFIVSETLKARFSKKISFQKIQSRSNWNDHETSQKWIHIILLNLLRKAKSKSIDVPYGEVSLEMRKCYSRIHYWEVKFSILKSSLHICFGTTEFNKDDKKRFRVCAHMWIKSIYSYYLWIFITYG